jgi:hypothetical protein
MFHMVLNGANLMVLYCKQFLNEKCGVRVKY